MQNAADFKPGERVRLVKMNDPYRKDIPIGVEGTVISAAPRPVNVVNVKWDAGFTLNPCLDVDVIERAGRQEPQRVFEISYKETYGGTFYVMSRVFQICAPQHLKIVQPNLACRSLPFC